MMYLVCASALTPYVDDSLCASVHAADDGNDDSDDDDDDDDESRVLS